MNFSSVLNAANVWSNPTRTLTGNNGAITTNSGVDNSALANGSTAFFLATAGTMAIRTIVGIAAANVTWNVGLGAGATLRIATTGASGASISFHAACSTTIGLGISNSGTVSGNYTTSAVVWNS